MLIILPKPYIGQPINTTRAKALGCIGAWVINEMGGDTIWDYSGQNRKGTISGSPVWSSSLLFDQGNDDYVDIPNIDLLATDNWTVIVKFYETVATTNVLCGNIEGIDSNMYASHGTRFRVRATFCGA